MLRFESLPLCGGCDQCRVAARLAAFDDLISNKKKRIELKYIIERSNVITTCNSATVSFVGQLWIDSSRFSRQ